MTRGDPKREPTDSSLSKDDIEGAVRVFQSLEQLVGRPRLLKEVNPEQGQLVALAKRIKALRMSRAKIFESEIFGEPAWDILLALYVAAHEGYRLKTSSVCDEANVPDTTALRWIDSLIELGLAEKIQNRSDARSRYVELTPHGLAKMDRFMNFAWKNFFPFD